MFASALVVMTIVIVVRLAALIRNDRPRTTPRSDSHDEHFARSLPAL